MIGATRQITNIWMLILNLAYDTIDNKFKGASTNFTLVNLQKWEQS